MSYEQNWGFTDPTDEFGAPVPLNDYGSGRDSAETYDFITKINLCAVFMGKLQCPCIADRFNRLKIISDFEPCSTLMVSRCVMENLPGIYANPVEGKNEVIVFDSQDDIDEKCFKATILLLLESFGLGVVFYDKSREDDDNSTESNPEITRVEYNFDDVIDCLLSFISHKVLDTTVWKAFASDGQKNGIYAKVSEDGPTFLDVVALKGFTINSDDGSIMLRFQTSSHRVTSPSLNDLLPENNYNVEEIKEISLVPGTEMKPLSLILLPTGEEVTTFHSQKSYRGVLLPAKKKVPVDQKRDCGTVGKKNKNSLVEKRILDDSEENFESILLTKFDLKNRKRAYSLFLPDNKEKCDEYWRLGYGVILKSDANFHKSKVCQGEAKERSDKRIEIREEENSNGYHLTEVTMELGDQRIIPTQLLVSSIAMITSRTRRLALSIAETFTALLRGIPLLESVTEPIRLQTGYGISSRTVISAPTDFTDARISCSLSSRFQTASSLVKNVSKDLNRKTVTNTVEINKKRQNFEQNEETSNRGNDQNCENGKKFFSVKGAFVSANITELAVKKLPFTVPVRSVLPVKKLSKFKIPGKIPGDVIILKDDKNKKGLTDNVAGGKRKSSEIGDKYIISKLQKKINSEDKDKNEKNELDNNEHRKEKKKLGGKKDPVSPEKELKKNNSVEQGRIGAKSSKKTKTESSVVRQNVKVTAKQRKAIYQNDKTSGESIVKQTAVIPDSMIRASTPSIVTKKKENKNEKPPRKTEETLSKTAKMSSENIEKSAQPGPSIPVSLSGGGESSGDDSLSLGSENEINDAGDDEDDDNALFFEE